MAKVRWLLLAVLLLVPRTGAAQQLSFRGDEYVGGAAFNVLLRGPWISPGWRAAVPRAVLFSASSVFYEQYLDRAGWQWSDVVQRAAGYLTIELALVGVRHLLHRRP